MKSDGSVVHPWGTEDGLYFNSVASELSSGVSEIFTTGTGFAALKSDGSVVNWGDTWYPCNGCIEFSLNGLNPQLSSGVVDIYHNTESFAALKSDGSIVTWGDEGAGDSSSVSYALSSGVIDIIGSTSGVASSFAALKSDFCSFLGRNSVSRDCR